MGLEPKAAASLRAAPLSALPLPAGRRRPGRTGCQDPGKHIFSPLSSAREEPMPVGGPSAGCLGCTARGQRQGQEGHGPRRRGSRHLPENELTTGSPKNTRNLRPGVGPAGFPRKKRSLEGGAPRVRQTGGSGLSLPCVLETGACCWKPKAKDD